MTENNDTKKHSEWAQKELDKRVTAHENKVAEFTCYVAFVSNWDKFPSIRFEINNEPSVTFPYNHRGKITYDNSRLITMEFPDVRMEIHGKRLNELHRRLELEQVAIVRCAPHVPENEPEVKEIRMVEV